MPLGTHLNWVLPVKQLDLDGGEERLGYHIVGDLRRRRVIPVIPRSPDDPIDPLFG